VRSPDVDIFLKSLSTAWKDGEARPTHRKQPGASRWWRTKVDPFADAWPLVEGWLIAEPSASAKELMYRFLWAGLMFMVSITQAQVLLFFKRLTERHDVSTIYYELEHSKP